MLTEEQVREALTHVMDPELQRDLVSLGMVRSIEVTEQNVQVTLALTTLACPLKQDISDDVRAAVQALGGPQQVDIVLSEMTAEERERAMGKRAAPKEGSALAVNRVEHVLAVMSGKGGVGKSLVTGLLAAELRRRGLRVGILDADITGPSIPKMFGVTGQLMGTPFGIAPGLSKSGIKVMSINLLLPQEDDAVIWRGPLIAGAIKQFWGDVVWGGLDYLLVDLPPGTADAPLTVMQSLPLNGVVLVTSPQDLAGMVVRKAARMAAQLEVPILGIIENMSYAICPHCGEKYEVFGASHAERVTEPLGIALLGRIPLDPRISDLSDHGRIEEYELEGLAGLVDELVDRTPDEATKPRF
ncbi:MAG: Mrp/NBP35 family ATP-binding protein [Chloroflexi bacterium]|nr:Mrp/NBP35 family ATP-binding protein [Chloroflexota bacterium]